MEKETFIPTRNEVRLELQGRLLADAMRLGTLYGSEKVARLVGKIVAPDVLVAPSMHGYGGELTLELAHQVAHGASAVSKWPARAVSKWPTGAALPPPGLCPRQS